MILILRAFSKEYFRQLRLIRKKNIIFFNGCFDLIHPGHLKLINQIKNIGRNNYPSGGYQIICGLNSNKSVELQNKSHPLINSEHFRAELLKELGIDYVILFDEETPTSLIMSLVPDIVVKGNDYKNKGYDEEGFLIDSNINIKYIELLKGYSSTNIYNSIEEQIKAKIRESI